MLTFIAAAAIILGLGAIGLGLLMGAMPIED